MKLKTNCLVLLDSNICIYRTLGLVNPPIYPRTELDGAINKIHEITNSYKGKIIITDIVIRELQNKQILFQEIFNFWKEKLHGSRLYSVQRMMRQAEKSINKLFSRYIPDPSITQKLLNYKKNISKIDLFYLSYPQKLKDITERKTKGKTQPEINRKLLQRPNNLPEETDRHLLAQAMELRNGLSTDVHLFSDDSDFREFKLEIKSNFNVSILSSDDTIDRED